MHLHYLSTLDKQTIFHLRIAKTEIPRVFGSGLLSVPMKKFASADTDIGELDGPDKNSQAHLRTKKPSKQPSFENFLHLANMFQANLYTDDKENSY